MTMSQEHTRKERADNEERIVVSLKTLARLLDAHRTTVHRWLKKDGIRPIVFGQGRKGAVRYWWRDIQQWLDSRERVS